MTTTSEMSLARPLPADPDDFRHDLHAGYAKYRPRAAVISFGAGFPVVIRHGDVTGLMTDPRTRQLETEGLAMRGITSGALHDFYSHTLLLSNPPDHARRRAPLQRAFAHRLIQELRPRIRALVAQILDEAEIDGTADFRDAVASPLPARLTAEILGAPREDTPRFAAMVYAMGRGLADFGPDDFPQIERAAGGLRAYVEELLQARRVEPREDFLTSYLARVEETGDFDPAETVMQIVTLIIAGSDTTRFGLTALLGLLLTHREQWEKLRADPAALAPGAVLEALRFEPAVGSIGRVVTEPLEIGGIVIEPDTVLNLSIVSAQRDETVFAEPQRFDIARADHPRWSLSFGFGAHRCLGEALARAEMEETLIVLAERYPDLALAGGPPGTKGHSGIRTISPLPVRWR